VGAKKEDAPIAITLVLIWAIVMIFVLPIVAHALALPAGVGGAWIGTSEFADAAGIAAAQTYAGIVSGNNPAGGTGDQAVMAFTLMKVVGRDVWIGIWAFVLAIVATTYWEKGSLGRKANAAEIWWRFPKFVIGFFVASLIVTWVTRDCAMADFNKIVNPGLVAPIKDLRSWAFIFCFLSIGLTTRFRELASAGVRPFIAFTSGVVVNVILGLVLSAWVFASYWTNLAHDARARKPPMRKLPAFPQRPGLLEAAFKGLSAMSSAWGSVCADDGLCLLHDRHLSAQAYCDKFSYAEDSP